MKRQVSAYARVLARHRPGTDLIAHYLDPDRLPARDRWSRKYADIWRRLCERFAAPVIAAITCQDIKTEHTQKIVNAAPTAGVDAGYLTSPRLAKVHWQAGDRLAMTQFWLLVRQGCHRSFARRTGSRVLGRGRPMLGRLGRVRGGRGPPGHGRGFAG